MLRQISNHWIAGKNSPKAHEIEGQTLDSRTGPLVVLRRSYMYNGHRYWRVRCERGHETDCPTHLLMKGTASCKDCKQEQKGAA